ncbi:MAG: CBM20 domain-containing protein, partial [Bacteroidota bacterium]
MKPLLTIIFIVVAIVLKAQVSVNFQLACPLGSAYKYVGLRGDTPPLSWEKSTILELKDGHYSTNIDFQATGKTVEYKYVLFNKEKAPVWESIDNRKLKLVNELAQAQAPKLGARLDRDRGV